MKSFFSLIEHRQSCRDFNGDPLILQDLHRILEAGCIAPSACNTQPWHFYATVGASLEEIKRYLNPKFQGAGGVIFIVEVPKPLPIAPENPFRQMDIGLATMQMTLAAESLGYASCIVGAFDKTAVTSYFGLSAGETVRLALVLGHATDPTLREKDRLPTADMVEIWQ